MPQSPTEAFTPDRFGGLSPTALSESANKHSPMAGPQTPSGPGEDDERRVQQRQKQVQYGMNTAGYNNMMRLVVADPRLLNGGVIPLKPPSTVMRTSKRNWDALIRKWRRALHMFDHVFIDGEDDGQTTREEVLEKQRIQWVSARFCAEPKSNRVKLKMDHMMELRASPHVPKKIPVEDNMLHMLRSLDCQEPMAPLMEHTTRNVNNRSPPNTGVKMMIAPSTSAAAFMPTSSSMVHARSPSPLSPLSPEAVGVRMGRSPSPEMPPVVMDLNSSVSPADASAGPASASPSVSVGKLSTTPQRAGLYKPVAMTPPPFNMAN